MENENKEINNNKEETKADSIENKADSETKVSNIEANGNQLNEEIIDESMESEDLNSKDIEEETISDVVENDAAVDSESEENEKNDSVSDGEELSEEMESAEIKEETEKNHLPKKNNKKYIIGGICVAIILSLVALCYAKFSDSKSLPNIVDIIPLKEKINIEKTIQYDYIETFDANKAINKDYVGQIIFESGIINEPFVASKDNNDYLRKNFFTGKYDETGTVFMDYESSLDSQNIVLYGHYVYSTFDAGTDESGKKIDTDTLKFTPLKFLNDYNFYQNNDKVMIILENEIREYQICAVYFADLVEINGELYPRDDQIYYVPEFTKDYFTYYKSSVENNELYDTGVEYKHSDDFLTLQTCVEGDPESREIVLCKYVGKTKLDRKGYEKYKKQIAEQKAAESDGLEKTSVTE